MTAVSLNAKGKFVDDQAPPGDRDIAVVLHLAPVVLNFASQLSLLPFGGALLTYFLCRNRGPFLKDHAVEELNFQISMLLYGFIAAVLAVILIGLPMLLFLWVIGFVFPIIAAIAAGKREYYRYPLTIRLVHG